jgi:hypothetical protein
MLPIAQKVVIHDGVFTDVQGNIVNNYNHNPLEAGTRSQLPASGFLI